MDRFTTADDAKAAISEAIQASGEVTDAAADYDIDAIFADCYSYDPALGHIQDAGFVSQVDGEDFWALVQRHDKS